MNKLHAAYLRYVIAQHNYYATHERYARESQVAWDVLYAAHTAYHEAHESEHGTEPAEWPTPPDGWVLPVEFLSDYEHVRKVKRLRPQPVYVPDEEETDIPF